MTALPPLTSTGRLPADIPPARLARTVVDPVALRAELIAAGVIRERDLDLPPLRVALEGETVVRMRPEDHRIAAAHIAQGRAGSRRVRDEYESADRRESRYGGRR
ncbi:MAG: hypothetical protein IPM35_20365 [Myxococcales bacterium]|nr:hypothetical protein [Myxococcales bacterium]